ncbi:MAG: transposase [Candidatus Hydrogenedentes bacterium]|nr:transposase [Candidatus Hydrogenedentota bacterium]
MTCTVYHWAPVFTRPDTVAILLDGFDYLMGEGLVVYAYVVLDNHVHFIARSPNLEKTITRLKYNTGRQLLKFLNDHNVRVMLDHFDFYPRYRKDERDVQFWQESVHPELILNDTMMAEKIRYIHENPVKRGYVDRPEHWRYSSARNYAGERGLLRVTRADGV